MSPKNHPVQQSEKQPRSPTDPHVHHDDRLPAYSERTKPPDPRPPDLTTTPGLPPLVFARYAVPDGGMSPDDTTLTVSSAQLCRDADALTDFIATQAALPPRPQIHITGVHDDYGDRTVDFDLRLDLLRYLVPSAPAAPLNYMRMMTAKEVACRGAAPPTATPHVDEGLQGWTRRFCQDESPSKEFVLDRVVPNWNTALLEGRIRNLLAALKYQGRVTIRFPITHRRVVVSPPAERSLLPRLLALVRDTKRYAVVQSVWPYADVGPGGEQDGRRTCVVQSEDQWWQVWREALAAAIVEKRRGRVTLEDVMDRVMGGRPPVVVKKMWGESG